MNAGCGQRTSRRLGIPWSSMTWMILGYHHLRKPPGKKTWRMIPPKSLIALVIVSPLLGVFFGRIFQDQLHKMPLVMGIQNHENLHEFAIVFLCCSYCHWFGWSKPSIKTWRCCITLWKHLFHIPAVIAKH